MMLVGTYVKENWENIVVNPYENESFHPLTFSQTSLDSSDSSIESGMNNTIIVPSSIFTNSYFYQHEIVEGNGNESWPTLTFYGDDSSADSTTAHISGIITGNLTGSEVYDLLTELSKNTTGTVTYNYSLEDPTQLNLPPDALKLVPFSGYGYLIDTYVKLSNSPTGQLPQSRSIGGNTPDSWLDDLAKGAVNLGISVGTAVWDKAVDLGTELAHIVCSAITAVAVKFTEFVVQLGKAIIDFGKKAIGAFETALNEVKAAVDKVVEVIGAIIEWIKEAIANAVKSFIEGLTDVFEEITNTIVELFKELAEVLSSTSSSKTRQPSTFSAARPLKTAHSSIGDIISDIFRTIATMQLEVLTSFSIFAAIEVTILVLNGGFTGIAGAALLNALKITVLELMISSATMGSLDAVSSAMGGGITDSTVSILLTAFGISTAYTAMVISIYELFKDKAEGGKFYFGTSLAFAGFIAALASPADLSGDLLMGYDIVCVGIAGFGLYLMYRYNNENLYRPLPYTDLLEWITGWISLVGSLTKLGSDASKNFQGG